MLGNIDLKDAVGVIVEATPTYNRNSLMNVISDNIKEVNHPYFSEYRGLQKLCLQILRHKKIKYGSKKDEIYGVLIDMSWLWEEYLAKILKDKFKHCTSDKGFSYLF